MVMWSLMPLAIVAAAPAAPAATTGTPAQAALDRLAATLGYRFAVVTNRVASCPGGAARCFRSAITITVPSTLDPRLATMPVEIRFGFVNRVLAIDSDDFAGRQIKGDVHALTLKPGRRLRPGASYRVVVTGVGAFYSRNHAMPNAMLLAPGLTPQVIAATRPGTDADTGLETLPFVDPMTDEAALAGGDPADRTVWLTPERAFALYAGRGAATPVDVAILPRPVRATRSAGAPVAIGTGFRVVATGIPRPSIAAALATLPQGSGRTRLTIRRRADLAPEGYRLVVRRWRRDDRGGRRRRRLLRAPVAGPADPGRGDDLAPADRRRRTQPSRSAGFMSISPATSTARPSC